MRFAPTGDPAACGARCRGESVNPDLLTAGPTMDPLNPVDGIAGAFNVGDLVYQAPMMALVGVSISGMPGPPLGPSKRMTTTMPLVISPFSMPASISSSLS